MVRRYGNTAAMTLVRDFLTRDERDGSLHSRHYPIIVFTGPRGTGKTALVDELARQLEQRVPYARIDCARFRGGARELLALLAFDLNRYSGKYGTLSFPRLITGEVVISAQLDRKDRKIARAQAGELLEDYTRTRRLLQAAFSEIINGVIQARGGVPGLAEASPLGRATEDMLRQAGTGLILGGLAKTRRGRRLLLGTGQEWWGHQDRGLNRPGLDVLVDLNRMARSRPVSRANRQAVTELLWAAFLADLRDSFRHSRRAIYRTLNCVVMLDNVDDSAGEEFLAELVKARRSRIAFAPDEADPLTVIATSRGSLAERVCLPERAGIVALAEAAYDDYLGRCDTPTGRSWYPVRLPDLTADEVSNMVADLELPVDSPELPGGSRRQVSSAVYRFTAGHPGATCILLDAIAERPDRPADLPAILGSREAGPSGAGRRTVEQRMLAALLAGVPGNDDLDDLMACAAARDKEAALHLATESGLLTGMRGEGSVIFAPELWRAGADSGSSVLHAVLGRLLSRRLAERPEDAPASWRAVHGWLRDYCRDAGDETGEMYHALALDDLEYVARRFAGLLADAEPAEWLRLLDAVTTAPNRLDHSQPTADQIRMLTKWSEPREAPLAPVGRLVAACWIDADPMSDQHRPSLLREKAADLDLIAPSSKGIAVMREYAEACRAAAAGLA